MFLNKKDIAKLIQNLGVFALLLMATFKGNAQQTHFSQFDFMPIHTNVALTGSAGNWRVGNLYRSQWAAISNPYVTNALFYDRPIVQRQRSLGAGLFIIYDRSGDFRRTNTHIALPLAYHIPIQQKSILSLGTQIGFRTSSINAQNHSFPDQWDIASGTFNTALPSADVLNTPQQSRFTLNTGLALRTKINNNPLLVGIQIHDVIPVKETFLQIKDESNYTQFSPHASYRHQFKSAYFVEPLLQYHLSNKASSMVTGLKVGKNLTASNGLKLVYVGSYIRTGVSRNLDAFIPNIGAKYKNFDVGLSYDLNLSGLKTATSNRGGFELAVIYTDLFELIRKTTPNCERM